jgi:hypothetical protein
MHRQRSTPQKHYFPTSGTRLFLRLSKPQGLMRPEGLGKLKKIHSAHSVSVSNRNEYQKQKNKVSGE